MDQEGLPRINLDDYSGIIVGGGPSSVSDKVKSPEQEKFEPTLFELIDEIIRKDFPYLGACYGLGALAERTGGRVSKEKYSEDVGATTIKLSEAACSDPLTARLPKDFRAFVGHKEACQDVPPKAVLLASSSECPVQMIRFGKNVYATQFHPELDSEGLALRIKIYKDYGYFRPEEAQNLIDNAYQETVTVPEIILQRFIKRYRQK
jgi:GMP synthase (glutamine-hydrolysing)